MDDKCPSRKSLAEEICDELFANIEKHKEFDEGLVKMLKLLSAQGELSKPGRIMDIIKGTGTQQDEAAGVGN